MKLAALGVVTSGIGIALGIPGLMGIGVWWVAMGLLARQHAARLKALQPANPEGKTPAAAKVAVDGRTFAMGTALFIALGVPSLVIGLWEIGIDAEHQDWRWLPIVVGGLALTFGVLGGILYLAGSAALAVSDADEQTVPATLRIRSVRETGTYVNERPRLEFEFLVEPDPASGIAPYNVTKKATVPFTSMAYLRVGDGFKAMVVGPEKPTSMEIHWDQPVTGAGG